MTTALTIEGEKFLINGQPTYAGRDRVAGMLFNVRTVHATFDDTLGNVSWWDDDGTHPENDHAGYGPWRRPASAFENTKRYVEALPQYRDRGILAVNLCLQGGHPLHAKPEIAEGHGSAGHRRNGHRDFYYNSGFFPGGSIDEDYADRIGSIIEACDRLGMVTILELFYFGQDTVFSNEGAILAAVDHAVDFVCSRGYRNVILEIANEIMLGHYHHAILKPERVAELIVRARERIAGRYGMAVPVSTSEAALLNPRAWTAEQIDRVFGASDVVLLHTGDGVGDGTELARKIDLIRSRPWFVEKPRPIVCNESEGEASFEAGVSRGVPCGLISSAHFQTMFPPKWGVWKNATTWFFDRVAELTGSTSSLAE